MKEQERQENFENGMILEVDLGYMTNDNGSVKKITIDDMKYNKLDQIQLEKGDHLSKEEESMRSIYVWFKLKQLSEEEKNIAWKYYVEGKTPEIIAKEMRITTNNYGDKNGKKYTPGKKRKVSQSTIYNKIKKIESKLRD